MKKMKKIMAAAIAMMTFSTAAAVTGTVAWFTANNIVSVSGMQIQADTEEGILISNEEKSEWKTSAVASHNTALSVIPTSTADAATWYRNNSDDEDIYGGAGHIGAYKVYNNASADANLKTNPTYIKETDGAGIVDYDQLADEGDADNVADNKNIYLLNKFYLKSSTNVAQTKPLYVNKVLVTGNSVALHKAVRILVKCSGSIKIYSFSDATTSYNVNGSTAVTTVAFAETIASASQQLVASVTIPANNTDSPLEVSVYAYFEGEDTNCTSTNANATNALNALSAALEFGTVAK